MIYDVAVIGAGVCGALIARNLSRFYLNVCVLEQESDVAMGTTRANSAIVHSGFDAKPGTLKAKLNVEGCGMMPELCGELHVPYRQNGSLVLAFDKEDVKHIHALYERGLVNGVKNLKLLNREELQKQEPNLSEKVLEALYAPSAGIVCPYELALAAIGNAMDNGVRLKLCFKVTALSKEKEYFCISSENETVKARYVVNAAGLFADEIAKAAGEDGFFIAPRKGEYMLLDKAQGGLVNSTIFQCPSKMGKGILVTPTVDGNLLIGPTSENILDKTDSSTTQQGLEKVASTALKSVPGIQLRAVITSFAGLRACAEKEDFIIEPSKKQKGLIHVAGIESPGLSASPAIARYVMELLKREGISLKANPAFQTERRPLRHCRQMSMEMRNQLIQKEPRFGRVICRCEGITEGEIIEAIHKNPGATTLDGVKRRTRAGMGRCQGGFCTPSVIEILARELGVSMEQVTKSGGDSRLLAGKCKAGECVK